jgi:hypothetical protein
MGILGAIGIQQGLVLLGSLLGGIWTAFKADEQRRQRRVERLEQALRALEAGVDHTYETYVRAIKAAAVDGKLTREERRRARDLARGAAIEFGRTRGVDVLQELGEDYVNVWIAKLVKKLKRS